MSVNGVDNRRVIDPSDPLFSEFPLPAVTAIDARHTSQDQENNFFNEPADYIGSGIVISPNYVLTAAHNAVDIDEETNQFIGEAIGLRATTSAFQNELDTRNLATAGDLGFNVVNRPALTNFNQTLASKDDILLLETSNTLLDESQVVGLIAFVDPSQARGLDIQTAGYPADNVPNTVFPDLNNPGIFDSTNIPGDFARVGRDLVLSPGFGQGLITSVGDTRRFFYSSNVDTFGGQSGSGVWHTLEGDDEPRVLGVHTQGGSRNNGVLINLELYDEIISQIEEDEQGINVDLLPENAIIGSDSFLSFGGNDDIFGSYRRERIIGNGGEDRLFGGGANDRLEGGAGTDQALFTDVFANYDWTIIDPNNPAFEFDHVRGSQIDGKDTTKDIEFGTFEFVDANKDGEDDDGNLFFVPLQVDPEDPTKLKDGPLIRPKEKILDDEGEEIATITVESPAWTFDGDVNYNLSIGLDITERYNIAFIIDRSGSTGGGGLAETKIALNRLVDSFVDSGIDPNIDFSIISFSNVATRSDTKNPDTAKSLINGLTSSGGTLFSPALASAASFFATKFVGETDLAYFISDGQPNIFDLFSPNASSLKAVTDEVRAFGVGQATLSTLNIIDSDGDAEFLSSAGDLFDAFDTSIDRDIIEHVEVRLEGRTEPIQIISPDQLTVNGFNLTYEGTIDGLEVSREAENNITFEIVFKEEAGIENLSLDYKITSGQEEIRQQTNNGRSEVINFSVNQTNFIDSNNESFSLESAREIVGNSLENVFQIQEGNNTISGNEGDDRFVLLGGNNFVDGGDGVDIVEIDLTRAEAGEVSKSGDIVEIGTNIAAQNVEYIEFTDVILSVDTLSATPVISFADTIISTPEGDLESTFATFNINLSSVATEDIVIDVSARSDIAEAGIDFIEPTTQFIIAAGENTGNISLEILGDVDFEGNEEIYLDLTIVSGATFGNGAVSTTIAVNIIDNETNLITNEDTLITISASRLLSDYASKLYGDFTESDFSIVGVNSTEGTAIINAEGNVEFTPAANLNGIVSFELTVTDGVENYLDLVEINVNPINDILTANNDTVTTDEDTPITILPSQLLGNDINYDIEKNLSISQISNLVNGTAVLSKAGVVRFTPDTNFSGIASFDYIVTDGIDSETASVEVNVNPINDSPVANDDTATTDEDTSLTILATDLLSNDIDVDGDNLSIIGVESNNGTAIINSEGNIEFIPVANFNGIASLSYVVTDGTSNSTGLVEIVVNSVNDILIVNDDVASTDEDTPVTILSSDLFSNDINNDVEKSLSVSQISNLVNGSAFIDSNGNIRFTPAFNFNGTASFDYIFTDGIDSETASVEITVNPVNDAPIVANDTATTDEDTAVIIPATELLSNDSDIEGDSLSVIRVSNSTNGTAFINSNGNVEFTPNNNFNGLARFNYTVTDGNTDTIGSVVVSVASVNDPVVLTTPIPDITVGQNAPDSVIRLDDHFEDVENGDNLAYDISFNASFSGGGDQFFDVFELDSTTNSLTLGYIDGITGTALFSVNATDLDGASIETSFTVTVNNTAGENDSNDDTFTTNEDTNVTILATDLLSNDVGNNLEVVEVDNAVNGTATLNEDGNIEFTPDTDFNGTASFDYIVSNGTETNNSTVEVIVNPINDAPILTNPIPDITVSRNASNSVIELTNYFDDVENGSNLAYSFSSSASFSGGNGQFFDLFTLDPATNSLILDYADDVIGTATIRVTATDIGNESIETFFSVTVEDTAENLTIIGNTPGEITNISIEENNLFVADVDSSTEGSDNVTYSILSTADGSFAEDLALFTIDPNTGLLSFINAPDFENPSDSDGNNIYQVDVVATSGNESVVQFLDVTVTNVISEGLTIDGNTPGDVNTISVEENNLLVTDVNSSTEESGNVTYSILSAADGSFAEDSELFTINPNTGELSFINAPDFENPLDSDGNNIYQVDVVATSGNESVVQLIDINVTDNASEELTIIGNTPGEVTNISIAENSSFVVDVDSNITGNVTYRILGIEDQSFAEDAELFTIDTNTGVLSFINAPDFENPLDSNGDNIYQVDIEASLGGSTAIQFIDVTVNDVLTETVQVEGDSGEFI